MKDKKIFSKKPYKLLNITDLTLPPVFRNKVINEMSRAADYLLNKGFNRIFGAKLFYKFPLLR